MPQLVDDVGGNLRMLLLVLTERKLMDLQLRINCAKAKCSIPRFQVEFFVCLNLLYGTTMCQLYLPCLQGVVQNTNGE